VLHFEEVGLLLVFPLRKELWLLRLGTTEGLEIAKFAHKGTEGVKVTLLLLVAVDFTGVT
jgi:hypothetical protein